VAPAAYETDFTTMECYTDSEARVTMEYEVSGDMIPGFANYLIIGIKGNVNAGREPAPTPTVGVTPTTTPTPFVTPSVTPTQTVTPTITPTITPTESASIFGENTRLYTAPSPGDPGGVGPGGIDTQYYDTCDIQSYEVLEREYFVSLQNLSGGVLPYLANFTFIEYTGISGWWRPPNGNTEYDISPHMSLVVTYHGGTGETTNPLRSNLDTTMIPHVKFKTIVDDPTWFDSVNDYYVRYGISGRIIFSDSSEQFISFYVPTDPTPVGGSNLRDPVSTDHQVSFYHWGDCDDCFNCR
jgi:hypothetical protein